MDDLKKYGSRLSEKYHRILGDILGKTCSSIALLALFFVAGCDSSSGIFDY